MAQVKNTPLLAFLLLAFLLFASEKAEGRICETASKTFNGLCFRNSNCARVCEAEHFSDGVCQGARRRCICRKHC